jgi:multiple sugar transport system substrate-binding protein
MITSKTRFDITYHASGFYENFLIPNGLEYDMTELVKAQKVDMSRYEQTAIDTMNQLGKGKIYSLPVYGNNTILYYNKSIFDKFGTAYPANTLTWAQMSDLSKKLTRQDAGTQYYGFGFTPGLFTRMNPMSIATIDLKTNTPTINTNDLWKTFIDRVFVQPFPQTGMFQTLPSITQFTKDKNLGMMAYLSSFFSLSIEELKQVDWDVVPLPSFEDKPGVGSQINSINFGVTNIAKNKEAAAKVVAYMGSDEYQLKLSKKGIMPVLKNQQIRDAIGSESVFKDKNLKTAVFSKQPAPVPEKTLYDADMITIYSNYGLEVWKGTMDANTAIRKAEEDAKKKIDEHIASGKYK